jgi:hypothetical protein
MASDLTSDPGSDPGRSTDRLPLAVFAALAGVVLWMVIAAWVGFAGPGYANVALTVVTGLLVVAIAIPFVLWRMVRANDPDIAQPETFSDWQSADFETWQDRQKGRAAATEIILPIAAAAVGMTAFAIVFHFAAAHAV